MRSNAETLFGTVHRIAFASKPRLTKESCPRERVCNKLVAMLDFGVEQNIYGTHTNRPTLRIRLRIMSF